MLITMCDMYNSIIFIISIISKCKQSISFSIAFTSVINIPTLFALLKISPCRDPCLFGLPDCMARVQCVAHMVIQHGKHLLYNANVFAISQVYQLPLLYPFIIKRNEFCAKYVTGA